MGKEYSIMPDGSSYMVQKDAYSKERGGSFRMLNVCCAQCSERVIIYQKDGPGPLLRCYLDRISWPPELVGLEERPLNTLDNLQCGNCETVIGTPMMYKPEDRAAFNMRNGYFSQSPYKPELEMPGDPLESPES